MQKFHAAAAGVFLYLKTDVVSHRRHWIIDICLHGHISRVFVARIEASVGLRIDAAADELSLHVSVPVVLDLVVGSPRQPGSNERPSITLKYYYY